MGRAAVAVLIWAVAAAADTNPFERDPEAIEAGKQQFETRCSGCHGIDARGARGPDLYASARAAAGEVDPLFWSIKDGIPGTEMISFGLSTEQSWQIVSYLRSLASPGAQPPVEGDVEAGREAFETAGCGSCHMIEGRGGILGPDLSGVAAVRTAEAIREAIVDPGKTTQPGFQGARIVDQAGHAHRGLIQNEDNFTIQLLTTKLERVSLDRAGLSIELKSLMPPDYGQRLSAVQLRNLLAFLDRQRKPTLHYEKGFGNY